MSGRARRHIAVRHRGGDRSYSLRFSAGGRRHYAALGSESDGWNPHLAERALLVLGCGFQVGKLSQANGRHDQRPRG